MNLRKLTGEKALKYRFPCEVLESLIWQESQGNPYAIRFEPEFYERNLRFANWGSLSGPSVEGRGVSLDTEKAARATSWGLCQLLGETMRWWAKCRNPFLSALLDPELNVELGARYLRYCMDRSKNNSPDDQLWEGLKLYNGAGAYADKILDHVKKKTYLRLYE